MKLEDLLEQTGISTQVETKSDLLEKHGLNWTVEKQPLYLPNGSETDYFGIVRTDNNTVFSTCKAGYEVYQNSELLELVNEAANNLGLSVNRGGSFKDGALVYLQLETGNLTGIGENNDTIKRYVSAMNSHDGSMSLKWGLTSFTISCRNTFWSAVKDMKNSVRHTNSMRSRIDAIMNEIRKVQKAEENLYKTFFKFAEVPVSEKHIEKAVKMSLDIDLKNEKLSDLTGYQRNRLTDLSSSIKSEMNQKGATLWGLFSGITHYTSHKMPGGDKNRAQSKAIGTGYKIDNKIFSEFAELVN